ncbi:P1 family peptidase [Deinococcus cellulosilyticus]|uniref:Uncharacterized protein n=1 Tax=Deinococcus cellulosilyticus (strain DSM 18568 / NBRC 106333 / KACC 11606 / 5516J-15) TaxID=1223518 RepID=A0A511N2U8_DEIC1|nr:P1 family peptidase [Deinococcus cellulosilyticus]GEM46756.1 hypothetical protein DC3_23910 [Deinococcus cellulosilyticus NBRC 106333 = KACC 11606]
MSASNAWTSGPTDSLTDVEGILVGHHTDMELLSGTTAVLFPEGAAASVDVRGAAPGTRETDLLQPENLVEDIQGLVLSGGSAFGLDAASGVVQFLLEQGKGFRIHDHLHVPIVPAAILFDLERGAARGRFPDRSFGYQAAAAATEGPVVCGSVGAGTGALAGSLKGGIGTASLMLPGGIVVSALVALNSAGEVYHPETGQLYADAFVPSGWSVGCIEPPPAKRGPQIGQNTTLAVVATNATLNKTQLKKVAQMAHDGFARAIHPVHTLFDGDTVFAVGTKKLALQHPLQLHEVSVAAADVVLLAIRNAVLEATSEDFPTFKRLLKTGP